MYENPIASFQAQWLCNNIFKRVQTSYSSIDRRQGSEESQMERRFVSCVFSDVLPLLLYITTKHVSLGI